MGEMPTSSRQRRPASDSCLSKFLHTCQSVRLGSGTEVERVEKVSEEQRCSFADVVLYSQHHGSERGKF